MTTDDIGFDVHIPADPRWYHAHFPGQPIVPGVVLLAALQAGCRDAHAHLHLGTLRAVRHLRFLQPVHAPATLRATVQVHGEWLHCALADPAGEQEAAEPGVASSSAPTASRGGGARRGSADVLRAQLQFDAVMASAADASTTADPAG